MINEDENNIYVDNKQDLEYFNKLKSSRYGSNSNIYFYNNTL